MHTIVSDFSKILPCPRTPPPPPAGLRAHLSRARLSFYRLYASWVVPRNIPFIKKWSIKSDFLQQTSRCDGQKTEKLKLIIHLCLRNTQQKQTDQHTFTLTLLDATEIQKFDPPPVSTFLSNYWRYCFHKHTNGMICSWRNLSWKLRSKRMPYGKVLTLWMRAVVCGAFQDKSWSFLVPEEAMKLVLFRVDC